MSTLYTVNDGDGAVAADLNQLVNALSNVLGITDTAQVALGRLVLPNTILASAPGSPVTGQMWMTTDEGASGGRLYVKHVSDEVPYLPLRQVQKSSVVSVSINSTSLVDVAGLSVSIVTTGGRLRIYLVPTNTDDVSTIAINSSGSVGTIRGDVKALVGATSLGTILYTLTGNGSSTSYEVEIPPAAFMWDYQPAAGSYTVKIQAATLANCFVEFTRVALVVEEWGD